jgi:two-component sensor histidine kinase/PAS domain-containing protein/CheY-like chemotaxis protein
MTDDRIRVAAAFALPLVLVAVAGWLAWTQTWSRAEGELIRAADSAAEYSARILDSALLAARLTDATLGAASDEAIRRDEERYLRLLERIMPELPVSNGIAVTDAGGELLVASTAMPAQGDVSGLELAPRDAAGPEFGTLTISQVNGRPAFSISIPRSGNGDAGAVDGRVVVSLDAFLVARGLGATMHETADVLSLLRVDGHVIASTGTGWLSIPRVPETSPLRAAMAEGSERGLYEGRAIGLREGLPLGRSLLIAYRQEADHQVYATVSRPFAAILMPWLLTMAGLLGVGVPTSIALGFLAIVEARRRAALGDSEAEFRAAFENATTGTALIDAASGRILKANRRLSEISGREASVLLTLTLDALLDPQDGDVEGRPPKLWRPDGTCRWVEVGSAAVPRAAKGAPGLRIATIHDVTEREEDRERQMRLAREVDHRAKNVLAIVQALLRLVRDPAARRAMKDVEGRVQALARAHDLMSSERWEGATLGDLLRDELAAYGRGAQIAMNGPRVRISPSAAQPLSMVLHELATNAVKHGALSAADGRLEVGWRALEGGGVTIRWEERSPGMAQPPLGERGAGMAILHGSVDQLGGTMEMDWRDAGLLCTVYLPESTLAPFSSPVPRQTEPRRADLPALKVLLVEDEYLVAIDTAETLAEMGCTVLGPARNLTEAESLLSAQGWQVDAAVLDVTGEGSESVEFARRLEDRGISPVFLTGYAAVPGAREGEAWTILSKPLVAADLAEALRQAIRG